MQGTRRKDSTPILGPSGGSTVRFAAGSLCGGFSGVNSGPSSPSSAGSAGSNGPAPMLGMAGTTASSRFFGISTRGAKLTRPLSTTADLGVIFTGFLEKCSSSATTALLQQAPTRKRRFVVLTNGAIRWYKRSDADELFGDLVGGVALKEVQRISVLDEVTFELASSDRRRRVFVAAGSDERDLWVEYISEALRRQQSLQNQASGMAPAADAAPHTACFQSLDAPNIELVVVRDGRSHAEVVRGHDVAYGAALRLAGVEVEDLVMLRLSHGGYLPIEGATLRERAFTEGLAGKAWKVMASSGDGFAMVKVTPSKVPEAPWFQEKEVLEAWIVALFALYSLNPLSLLVLGYIGHMLYQLWTRARQAVGAVDLVVESYELLVDEDDADRASKQMEIPPKFIDGCQGDLVEARRRWDITRSWREEYDIDAILTKPHPHFDTIKRHWPHFFLPHAKNGDPVYVERTGEFNMPAMLKEGVGIDALLHHCVFSTEYLYHHICDDYNKRKLITVYDLAGANLGDLKGEAKVFLRKGLGLVQTHYLERSRVIIIANAPMWFSILWRLLKTILNEATQKKVRVAASGSETLNAFREFIDIESIPAEYGGKLVCGDGGKDGCRWHSPQEEAMRKFVHELNAKHPGQGFPPVAPPYAGGN